MVGLIKIIKGKNNQITSQQKSKPNPQIFETSY